jgi:hypothetical protein
MSTTVFVTLDILVGQLMDVHNVPLVCTKQLVETMTVLVNRGITVGQLMDVHNVPLVCTKQLVETVNVYPVL